MKWEVKHDVAKGIIDAFLEGAVSWHETGEFTVPKRTELTGNLDEADREIVGEELKLMIASIRKRYKLQDRLPAKPVAEFDPLAYINEQNAEEPEKAEAKETEDAQPEEAPKPKRGRKTASTEKKSATGRNPGRKKKTEESEK